MSLSSRWNHPFRTCYSGKIHRCRSIDSKVCSSFRSLASKASQNLVSSYIVIGNGPIGASVAKHLIASLDSGSSVTIVDGRQRGMGSSHSDRARLIRTFDAEGDLDWTRWNRRSLKEFPTIERLWNKDNNKQKSFFTKCGALLLGDEEFVARSKTAAETPMSASSDSSFSMLSPSNCQEKWPYLRPKAGCDVALFDPLGGIIDPLALIEAQNHIAKTDGNNKDIHIEILSDVATSVRNGSVELASGKVLTATEKIIVCGGAYSESLLDHSGFKTAAPRASKRTVALLEVSEETVTGTLNDMPTIKYAFGLEESGNSSTEGEHSRVEAGSVYILPPVFYPEKDGKWFVKIGGGPNDFFGQTNKRVLDEWLSSKGDFSSAEWLEEIATSLFSGIRFESLQSMACVTTTTASSNGVTVDDVLGTGSLMFVSACQGKGAGPSDALGADIVQRIL